jgi:predicted GNAT superfamily acetyltransferase
MLIIRDLKTMEQQYDARIVFDKTWSMASGTEITPNLLQAMVHSGSYLSGAFIDNKIVGAAFAFPATNKGLHLHSHMTAVLDEYRDQGVGYALKIDQWSWAKKQNYSHLSWTFDPLVRRNAKLNVVKLGVDISAYYPNFYGEMPDVLNAGDESDRLMVSWSTDIHEPKSSEGITALLKSGHEVIDQTAWEKINASEVISGEIAGKPRVKEVDWKQLISLDRS